MDNTDKPKRVNQTTPTKTTTKNVGEENRRRFEEARKSLREMEKEIAPFVKRRNFQEHTTAGEWRDASDYERADFFRDLKKVSKKRDRPSQPGSEKR